MQSNQHHDIDQSGGTFRAPFLIRNHGAKPHQSGKGGNGDGFMGTMAGAAMLKGVQEQEARLADAVVHVRDGVALTAIGRRLLALAASQAGGSLAGPGTLDSARVPSGRGGGVPAHTFSRYGHSLRTDVGFSASAHHERAKAEFGSVRAVLSVETWLRMKEIEKLSGLKYGEVLRGLKFGVALGVIEKRERKLKAKNAFPLFRLAAGAGPLVQSVPALKTERVPSGGVVGAKKIALRPRGWSCDSGR